MTIQWDGQGEFSITETGPEYREYWIYNIGIGMITRLSPQVLLEPSLLVRSNGEDRDYMLANVSVVYLFTP